MNFPKNITEQEAFDVWVSMRDRSLRTLARYILRNRRCKVSVGRLRFWYETENWATRVMTLDAELQAEINEAALVVSKPKMVQERIVSMQALSDMYNGILQNAAKLSAGTPFAREVAAGGIDEFIKLLNAAEKLSKLQAGLVPTYHRQQEDSDREADEVVPGPVDPISLIRRLDYLVKRPALMSLRAEAEGKVIDHEEVEPPKKPQRESLSDIKKPDTFAHSSIHEKG